MNSEPIDPMWADLPLDEDMGIEVYEPVPMNRLAVLFALSCAGLGVFVVAACCYWGKP